ncbi:Conjugal transfer protein TrbJ [Novosphingobium resinovorum]|uniref:Conjugal transfer protein TrbJ n=1 Tax=Novosphingobium resinovorum TaxID=158500 RepID=A0A031JTL1_9SPHN|nr:P-type conjugative transfer protein TrbJ [Novosphingobium resinovorum]EZP80224.1 Conjugal transfer protein TrbJ [Novosphingobium resinovorum]
MKIKSRTASIGAAAALGVTVVAALGAGGLFSSKPAHALVVYDPSNYAQNVLTAARTLQQVNNQIKALQNQAQSLINEAKNLSTISFPELEELTGTLQQIDRLMGQAGRIQFRIADVDKQFGDLYPDAFRQSLKQDAQVAAARARLDTELAAYRQTASVQAQIAENVETDRSALTALVERSQGAEGSLQAQQATNQLLALVVKQQLQVQQMMAAQFRAQTVSGANEAQARAQAQSAAAKFLGTGSAYTPH